MFLGHDVWNGKHVLGLNVCQCLKNNLLVLPCIFGTSISSLASQGSKSPQLLHSVMVLYESYLKNEKNLKNYSWTCWTTQYWKNTAARTTWINKINTWKNIILGHWTYKKIYKTPVCFPGGDSTWIVVQETANREAGRGSTPSGSWFTNKKQHIGQDLINLFTSTNAHAQRQYLTMHWGLNKVLVPVWWNALSPNSVHNYLDSCTVFPRK